MADIIEMAREIGRQLQKDELYLKLELARQQSEEDEELQNAIGEFNLKRMAINNEASKADRSDEKMQQLNAEMRHAYAIIMSNENMIAYNEAKAEFDVVVNILSESSGNNVEVVKNNLIKVIVSVIPEGEIRRIFNPIFTTDTNV